MLSSPRRMPMFPLHSVLFPTAALPLQVFEARYLRMIDEVLEADRRFGVVLVTRGSEVGGGDERADTGTIARVVRVGALDDGRLTVVALGERRLRVVDWLADDPYPLATVVEAAAESTGPGTEALLDRGEAGVSANTGHSVGAGWDDGRSRAELTRRPRCCRVVPL